MFRNYIKIALRTFLKFKAYTAINIIGLAVGLACFGLIALYVNHELSYDKFYKNSAHIYRLASDMELGGNVQEIASSSYPAGRAIQAEFPETEHYVRFFFPNIIFGAPVFRQGDNLFAESQFYFADKNVLDIFDFEFLEGSPEGALDNPNALILTRTSADKYFGETAVIGKSLTGTFGNTEESFTVTAVIENLPENTHLEFEMLAAMPLLEAMVPIIKEAWNSPMFTTYLLLKEGTNPKILETKMDLISEKYIGDKYFKRDYLLEPLESVHLYSQRKAGFKPAGNIMYVYIFSAIAFFVLIIACINFLNMTTARSTRRATEVGLRKTLGAFKGQLARQFFTESFLMVLTAMLLGFMLFEFFLPAFNGMAGTKVSLAQISGWQLVLFVSATLVLVSALAGIYPAFYMSGFKPIEVLKGKLSVSGGSPALRKSLVTFQFAISTCLIICTSIVYSQLEFFQNKGLGFNKEHLVVLPVGNIPAIERIDAIKAELKRDANITGVTASYGVPGQGVIGTDYWLEGSQPEEYRNHTTMFVDEDFISTYGMAIADGRGFSREQITDKDEAFMLNKAAVAQFGWDNPIGKKINYMQPGANGYEIIKQGRVIGVVEDFHTSSLHNPISPLILHMPRNWGEMNNISVRIKENNIDKTLEYLEETLASFAPDWPFSYFFLDDNFAQQYETEQKLGQVFVYFSGLAIIIACLGLLGLASFSTEQRTKEIAIRKVVGASVGGIILQLSRDFLLLVGIGFGIAAPVAYFSMNQWLTNFAYPVGINPSIFVIAAVVCIVLAWLTIGWQAIRSASANPVKSLKYE